MELVGAQKPKSKVVRHYVIVMAFAVLGFLIMFGTPLVAFVVREHYLDPPDPATALGTVTLSTTTASFSRSEPKRLVISKLAIDTTFVPPLGLNPDKTVSVPDNYTEVGWYGGGATPGEVGPAVILGHVDSVAGPAVFYSLGKLVMGDLIKITRADGTKATFEVTELRRYPQSEFPTIDVYGQTNYPALRLVTCSGIFDHGKQQYSHNLVVYAKLVTQ